MKLVSFAVLLMAAMAFVVAGCSDNSAVPVSPTDQSAGVPEPLAKSTETQFAGLMWQAGIIVDPGVIKSPDGKMLIKGVMQTVVCQANTDLFTGPAVVTLDGIAEFAAGVPPAGAGNFYGKLTVTPVGGGGGAWDLNWHAKGTLGLLPNPLPAPPAIQELFAPYGGYGWTIPLKEGGPGKGGDLVGKHVYMENYVYCTPDLVYWVGVYTGTIRSN